MVPIRRILVATDFSECSDAAVEHAVYLAERLAAPLDFAHVIEGDDDPQSYWFAPGEPIRAERQDAFRSTDGGRRLVRLIEDRAACLADRVRGRLQFGRPAAAILRIAEEYDLVVLGTHGRHGVSRLMAGSIAEAVIRQAPCAVLTACSLAHRAPLARSRR